MENTTGPIHLRLPSREESLEDWRVDRRVSRVEARRHGLRNTMVRAKAIRPRDSQWDQPLWVSEELLRPLLEQQRTGRCTYGECLEHPKRRCRFQGDEEARSKAKTYAPEPKMVRDELGKKLEASCAPYLEASRGMKVSPAGFQVLSGSTSKEEEEETKLKGIPLPDNSFFKDLMSVPSIVHSSSARKKYSKAEDDVIIQGRMRDPPLGWDAIAALLPGRTGNMVKKRWGNRLIAKVRRRPSINKVRRPAAMAAIENFAEAEEESSEEEAPTPTPSAPKTPATPAPVRPVDRNNLYNQLVTVRGQVDEDGNPLIYYVLVWHSEAGKCDLVRAKQYGYFTGRSSRSGQPRYKLVPEGEGGELNNVASEDIRVVYSEAVYKLSDADKEAWNLLEKPRLPSPPPEDNS